MAPGASVIMLLVLNIGICLIAGLLSLSALFNVKESVASNDKLSLLCFVGLQVSIFLFLLTVFFFNDASRHRLEDFLELALPSIVYCFAMLFHFFRFQTWHEKYTKRF